MINRVRVNSQTHTINPPKDGDISVMIVALGLNVGVGHEEH
jgi:hypothetical protein